MTKDEFETKLKSFMDLPPAKAVEEARKLAQGLSAEEYYSHIYTKQELLLSKMNPVMEAFAERFGKYVVPSDLDNVKELARGASSWFKKLLGVKT